jgi:hypothetical protein
MSGSAVQKLIDKGFDGTDIHSFTGLNRQLMVNGPTRYVCKAVRCIRWKKKEDYEKKKNENGIASIAADHEKHNKFLKQIYLMSCKVELTVYEQNSKKGHARMTDLFNLKTHT